MVGEGQQRREVGAEMKCVVGGIAEDVKKVRSRSEGRTGSRLAALSTTGGLSYVRRRWTGRASQQKHEWLRRDADGVEIREKRAWSY